MPKRKTLLDSATHKKDALPEKLVSQATELPKKQLHVLIPERLHTAFKIKTVQENRRMGAVLEELIEKYVSG